MASYVNRLLLRPTTHLFMRTRCQNVALRCLSARSMSSHPTMGEPSIPEWRKPENEPADLKRARLLYQSRKRGMLENGIILSTFASRHLEGFDEMELDQYDYLINKPDNDWDLFYWVIGHKPTPAEYDNKVMDLLKVFAKNPDMELRNRQPDLPEEEQRHT